MAQAVFYNTTSRRVVGFSSVNANGGYGVVPEGCSVHVMDRVPPGLEDNPAGFEICPDGRITACADLMYTLDTEALRAERDAKLLQSDIMVLRALEHMVPDLAAYRQALRDLPEHATPSDPLWPDSPTT